MIQILRIGLMKRLGTLPANKGTADIARLLRAAISLEELEEDHVVRGRAGLGARERVSNTPKLTRERARTPDGSAGCVGKGPRRYCVWEAGNDGRRMLAGIGRSLALFRVRSFLATLE